ncbi:adenosine receptor A1-like [Lingula anatina]|uniref:Adenosine receptor A1-like n=1 Tax=Lingula anatina TaxID=7574 RepID=A0A1S3IU64_LINAN|nr:adenosine receptor A1-like [Lingula anatina]|eukprot:XP_013401074.2 adenosine receptor A1-like [Lingula anatina]
MVTMDFTPPSNISGNGTDRNVTQDQDGGDVNAYQLVTLVAQAILMIVICFGNGMVIAAFYRSEVIQTITNYYIMHLAVADFTVGLSLPFHIACFLKPDILNNIYVCIFRYSTLMTTQSVSVLCLLAITIDRYSAVVYHMRYHSLMTKWRAAVTIVAVWIIPIVMGVIVPFLWHNPWPENESERDCDFGKTLSLDFHRYISVGSFAIVTAVMLTLYSRIFQVAKRHAAQIEDLMANIPDKMAFNVNLKIAKTAAIVIGLFLLFWAPFFLILTTQAYGNLIHSKLLIELRVYASILALVNSGVNPVVYAYRLPEFRREFRKILHLKQSGGANSPEHDNFSANGPLPPPNPPV